MPNFDAANASPHPINYVVYPLHTTFKILPDFWYQPRHNIMISSEFGSPIEFFKVSNAYGSGFGPDDGFTLGTCSGVHPRLHPPTLNP